MQAQPKEGTALKNPSMGSPRLSKQRALLAGTGFWQRDEIVDKRCIPASTGLLISLQRN